MTYSAEVLADSPLAYYRLGEASGTTAADSSGNGRNGTYNNTPTLAVAGALSGDSDTAATFDGTNEDVSVANASWMNTGTAMTAECWIKTTASSGVAFSRGGGTSNPFHLSGSGVAAFLFRWGSLTNNASVTGTTAVNDGQWHHLVGTFDGTTLRLYVDGVLEGSSTGASGQSLWVTSADLRVASRGSTSFMAGTVDEAALYGTALSAARIAAHYAAGAGTEVAGEPFAAAATMLDGQTTGPIDIAGEPFAATATMLDGVPKVGITLAGEPFVVTATMLDGAIELNDLNIPPADLTLTPPAPAQRYDAPIPPADLTLTVPRQLVHNRVLLTTRWTFYDPQLDEMWTMPINPDSEANPLRSKGLTFGRNARPGGRYTTIRQTPRPVQWEFGGVIRTQEHHDALNEWAGRRRIIHVTDHVHRTYEVMLTGFEVTERAPAKNVRWRLRYSMKALLLRQLS